MAFREYIVRTPESDRRMLRVPEDSSSMPQQVVAMYTASNGESISNNTTLRANFGTRVVDTHNAVTTGINSWCFRAPKTGTYLVCSSATLQNFGSSSIDAWKELHLLFSADNSSYAYFKKLARDRKASEEEDGISGSCLIHLNEGEFICIGLYQNSGGTLSLITQASHNYVDIVLVGP